MIVGPTCPADSSARAAQAIFAGYLSFATLGLAVASWTSRAPQLVQRLDLVPSQFAFLLTGVALGGVLILTVSGRLVSRFGTRRLLLWGTVFVAGALALIGLSFAARSAAVLIVGVAVLGATTGIWDVAVAVTMADLERRSRRALMPRAFASFSLGAISGALLGSLATNLRVPVDAHLCAIALAVAFGMPLVTSRLIADVGMSAPNSHPQLSAGRSAWREPRTVMLGIVASAFAVLEGAGSSWIAIAAVSDRGLTAACASVLYVAFLASTTGGRWFAGFMVGRWGRVAIVRFAAVTAIAGVTVFAFLETPVAPLLGSVLWGVGISVGLPLSNSAAGERTWASTRVSVVTSMGYLGFLIGPPLVSAGSGIGTLSTGLAIVAIPLLGLAIACTPSLRPREIIHINPPAEGLTTS